MGLTVASTPSTLTVAVRPVTSSVLPGSTVMVRLAMPARTTEASTSSNWMLSNQMV